MLKLSKRAVPGHEAANSKLAFRPAKVHQVTRSRLRSISTTVASGATAGVFSRAEAIWSFARFDHHERASESRRTARTAWQSLLDSGRLSPSKRAFPRASAGVTCAA